MPLVPMSELLRDAYSQGYAVPSFCVWNAEMMHTVLAVADRMRAPVILMGGPSEFTPNDPATTRAIADVMVARYDVTTALLLDHGNSVDLARECLAAGYTSLMLDYSTYPYEANVAALREAVQLARPQGVTVEGELGHVGRADTMTVEGRGDSTLTDPEEAVAYVAETGVEALAVSIGNAHGAYTQLPRLDFDRLREIREAVSVPLALHGGSGTPEEDLRQAISLGIAKVNVATDLVRELRQSLVQQWQDGRNLWVPMAQAEALKAVVPVVEKWIRKTGAGGRL